MFRLYPFPVSSFRPHPLPRTVRVRETGYHSLIFTDRTFGVQVRGRLTDTHKPTGRSGLGVRERGPDPLRVSRPGARRPGRHVQQMMFPHLVTYRHTTRVESRYDGRVQRETVPSEEVGDVRPVKV